MLSSAIPIYNYLMDGLETYCENFNSSSDMVIAVKAELEKLEIYYEKTDDTTMYTIATGKLNIKHYKFIINLTNIYYINLPVAIVYIVVLSVFS